MNNLIFSDILESPNEKGSDVLNKILEQICKIVRILEDEVNIQQCHRVDTKSFYKPRDIMVQFFDSNYKQAVSKGRDCLSEGVKIRQDLPPELAYLNRALMPVKRVAESMPKYRYKVYISIEIQTG